MSDLRIQISPELFNPAASLHFDGVYDAPILKAGPDFYDFGAPLVWQIDITNTGDALLVTGSIEGVVKTACARCVEDFSFEITGDVEGYFLLNSEYGTPDDMDEDEFEVLPEDKMIDLEPLLCAALLIEFPLVPLCEENCKGLCATCGADLNKESCDCAPASDEGETPPNPFAALKDFPFDQN